MPVLSIETSEAVKDYRGDAVPVRRQKDRQARYKNVNMALIGTTKGPEEKNQVWNDRNKFKMGRDTPRTLGFAPKLHATKRKAQLLNQLGNPAFTAPAPRKAGKGSKRKIALDSSMYDDIDDGTIPGVLYSFDSNSTPTLNTGAEAWGSLVTQAETKWENKVFDNLVKTEYEMIETTSEEDSDEEFELI